MAVLACDPISEASAGLMTMLTHATVRPGSPGFDWIDVQEKDLPLSLSEVKQALRRRIEWLGDPSLSAHATATLDGTAIVGVILRKDGRLIQRIEVDLDTGKVTGTIYPEDELISISR